MKKENEELSQIIQSVFERFNHSGIYFGHGTENALDEAVALVFYVLDLPFDCDLSQFSRPVTSLEKGEIDNLVKKRINDKIPLAYLTNEAYFAGLKFYVDERVIVPRSPLSELIEREFEPWIHSDNVHSILDLCAGSACIAIACAYAFPNAQIDAVELCEKATEVAKINIEKHRVEEKVYLIQSDLFDGVRNKKYDVIISNPPYVGDVEMESMPKEYHHEPTHALRAEEEGLKIVLRILYEAADHLTEKGVLIVEVGNSQEQLEKRFPSIPFLWLEFALGGSGVFLLTVKQLREMIL